MSDEQDGANGEAGGGSRGWLRAALAELDARHKGRLSSHPASHLARLAATMAGAEDSQPRPSKDYDRIASLLADELNGKAQISPRRARDGAWCLWETKPAIAYEVGLLDRFLAQLQKLADKRASRALCNAYLLQYKEDRPGLRKVSKTLETLSFAAEEPYARLQREIKLFSLPEGPERLGRKALEQRQPPNELLRQLGLASEQLSRGGFVEPCALAALKHLAADRTLTPRDRLELVKVLAVDSGTGKLFFQQHKAVFANALLLPYASANPSGDIQSETLAALLSAIGDPRSRAAEWLLMPDAARIARRWLTKESINQFLDVVDEVALDRMWRWRRKFWNAVFDTKGSDGQSIIQEAWVVFDAVGYYQAKKMGVENLSVGRFRQQSSVQSGQSVLMLRIGRTLIAEWSHNGKVRIWYDADKKEVPRLYNDSYTAGELKGDLAPCDWDRAHMSPITYAWQDAVANKLHELTGIRIPRSRYELKP